MTRRRALGALLGLCAAAGVAAQSTQATAHPTHHATRAAAAADTPRRGGTLTVGLDSDPSGLDPRTTLTLGAEQVKPQIFDALFALRPDGKVAPGLVTRWREPSSRSLLLTLRRGVTFQDGTRFDAKAVKFNLDRQRAKGSIWEGTLSAIRSVRVLGPLSVRIDLRRPYSPLLSVLATRAGYMASPAAIRKWGSKFGLHPVGTGPFELREWVPNDHLTLERNPHYWQRGRPYLDEVRFRIIPDPTNKTVNLVSGALQTVDYVDPSGVDQVKRQSNLVFKEWPGVLTTYLPLNFRKAPLDDPKVREAISLAIDRKSIVENVALGLGEPARSMLSSVYWAFPKSLPPIPYDPARAKKLLGGRTLTLTMQVPPTYTQAAQVVKQNLASVGIKLNLVSQDWGQMVDNYYKRNFQVQFEDQTPQWPDPDDQLAGFYAKDGPYNALGLSDPRLERDLARAAATSDQAKRTAAYLDVQRRARQLNDYVPIYYAKNDRAWDSSVHGIPLRPDGILVLTDTWMAG